MIKVCSLEFLNKEVYDSDLMSEDGKVLFYKNDKVKPGDILRLYFQSIFVEKDLCELEIEEQNKYQLELEKEKIEKEAKEAKEVKNQEQEELTEEEIEDNLPMVFDEEKAKRIVKSCSWMGKSIGLPPERLEALEKIAYNYKIGISRFTKGESKKGDFRQKLAKTTYDILIKEMDFEPHIAEVAYLYMQKYESKDFKLDNKSGLSIPYSQIVSIADYYETLLEKTSKDEALLKMLQLGGNHFNIFVLHRFIDMKRKEND